MHLALSLLDSGRGIHHNPRRKKRLRQQPGAADPSLERFEIAVRGYWILSTLLVSTRSPSLTRIK
jgi:hypothetical protein